MGQRNEKAHNLARHAARLRAAYKPRSSQSGVGKPSPFDMALFTDERAGDPVSIIGELPTMPGIRLVVIFRHYETANRLALGKVLAAACRIRHFGFIVAGDTGMAQRLSSDGVHLPEWQISKLRGLKAVRSGWIVTAACHSMSALVTAQKAGADAAFLSPVFPTKSHPDAHGLGIIKAHSMASKTDMPVFALGGVNQHTAGKLKPGLFAGFGAIDGFKKVRT